jgi:hypothetical protein
MIMENTKVDTPNESTAVRLVLTESNYKRQFGNIIDPSRVLVLFMHNDALTGGTLVPITHKGKETYRHCDELVLFEPTPAKESDKFTHVDIYVLAEQ